MIWPYIVTGAESLLLVALVLALLVPSKRHEDAREPIPPYAGMRHVGLGIPVQPYNEDDGGEP